nr:putative ribonuclease H-like domain-containing protein [Tanacetum cinerariifolium]
SEEESNDEEDQDLRLSEEARIQEEEDADELYRDININQGRGLQVTQNVEDTHVTLTPVLVEAYEADKAILDTYGDSTILKRRREDDDQEGPSAGSNRGSKRQKEGGEQASASTPSEKATEGEGGSTTGSQSRKMSASESAFAEEPVQTTCQMEEPPHLVFETDFSNFIMHRLNVDTLTPNLLAGPTYELMRGLCTSLTDLEYHLEEGLVRGLPKLKLEKDHLCSACAMGKSTKKTHKPKSKDTNQEKLYLLHMDLCEPMHVESVNGKKYIIVIVNDYYRFTWVKFMRSKDETPMFIIKFLKMIHVRLNVPVRRIRTDNGTEFVNQMLRDYYEEVGISHETSVARSLQQNEVVERCNRTLIETARTMLIYAQAPLFLWAEVVATACFTQNRSIIRLRHGKTTYAR